MQDLPPEKVRAIEAAAEKAVAHVQDGMTLGLGTGHAAEKFILKLVDRIAKEKLQIRCVATSLKSKALVEGKIPLIDESLVDKIDITFDGADRADPKTFALIKGGGGALLREKLVALQSEINIMLIDDSKLTSPLSGFPLPVEVVTFGHMGTKGRIEKLGFAGKFRTKEGSDELTTSDNNNYIFDIDLKQPISDPRATHQMLKETHGVVETGIFLDTPTMIYVGKKDGSADKLEKP